MARKMNPRGLAMTTAVLLAVGTIAIAGPARASDPVTNDLVAVSDTRLDFGLLPFGEAAVTMTYSITALQRIRLETGSTMFVDLGPTDPWVDVGGGACAGYMGSDVDVPLTLEVGDVCTVSVTFRPSAELNGFEGPRNAGSTWTARAVATGAEEQVGVGYFAANPSVRVEPRDLFFGAVRPGQTSAPQTVTVTNLATVPIEAFGFSTPQRPEFAQISACAVPIPVGGTCTIAFTFSPIGVADLTPVDSVYASFSATGADGSRTTTNGAQVTLHGTVDLTLPPAPEENVAVAMGTRTPGGVAAGAPVFWDYVVTNSGPDSATDFLFSAQYDDQFMALDGSLPDGCVEVPPSVVDCTLTLAAGESRTITVPTRITDTTPVGSLLAAEGLAFNQWDMDYQDNQAFLQIGPTVAPLADLTAAIVPSTTAPKVGSMFDWVLTVTNDGPTGARSVTAKMTLPAGTVATMMPATCTATASLVTCILGEMYIADTTTLPITLTLAADARGGVPLESQVIVTSTTPDPDQANNSAVSEVVPEGNTPGQTHPEENATPPDRLAATGDDASLAVQAAVILLLGGLLLLGLRLLVRRSHIHAGN